MDIFTLIGRIKLDGAKKVVSELEETRGHLGPLNGGFKALSIGVLAGAGALAALGAAAFKLGSDFDASYDAIRIGTGATGEALNGLKSDFKSVFSAIPTDMASASTAIADLNTRLGLTGEPLRALSTQMLELSRITKTDVGQNIALATRLFGDWSVASADQSSTLDKVFRAAQSTGASVDSLMTKVVQFGAPLRGMGFSLDESVAMLGKWEKEGVNTELVLGSLRIAMGKFAADNIPMRKGLNDTIADMQRMGPGAAATSLAMEVFGARAGPDMAAAILEGRFAIDEYVAAIANGTDTIVGLGQETMDAGEKFTIMRNKIMTAIEPILSKVFDLGGSIVEGLIPHIERLSKWIEQTLVPAFENWVAKGQDLIKWAKDNWGENISRAFAIIADVAGKVASAIKFVWDRFSGFVGQKAIITGLLTGIAVAFAGMAVAAASAAVSAVAALAPVILIITAVGAAVALLYKAWESNFLGIRDIVKWVVDRISDYFQVWVGRINKVIDALNWLIRGWNEFGRKFASVTGRDIVPAIKEIEHVTLTLEDIGTGLGDMFNSLGRSARTATTSLEGYGDEQSEIASSAPTTTDSVAKLSEGLDNLGDSAKDATEEARSVLDQMRDIAGFAFPGETAMSDQLFRMQQDAKALRLEILKMGGDNDATKPLQDQLDELNRQMDIVRLQGELTWDPQRRMIERLIEPVKELGLQDKLQALVDIDPTVLKRIEGTADAMGLTVRHASALVSYTYPSTDSWEMGWISIRTKTGEVLANLKEIDRYLGDISNMSPLLMSPSLESYDNGGIVPGPLGAPQLAVVHGGEEFDGVGGGSNSDNRSIVINVSGAGDSANVVDRFTADPRVMQHLRPRPTW